MITNVIIILTIVIVGGVFVLDHFAIEREKQEQEAARKAREERRAAKEREGTDDCKGYGSFERERCRQ